MNPHYSSPSEHNSQELLKRVDMVRWQRLQPIKSFWTSRQRQRGSSAIFSTKHLLGVRSWICTWRYMILPPFSDAIICRDFCTDNRSNFQDCINLHLKISLIMDINSWFLSIKFHLKPHLSYSIEIGTWTLRDEIHQSQRRKRSFLCGKIGHKDITLCHRFHRQPGRWSNHRLRWARKHGRF